MSRASDYVKLLGNKPEFKQGEDTMAYVSSHKNHMGELFIADSIWLSPELAIDFAKWIIATFGDNLEVVSRDVFQNTQMRTASEARGNVDEKWGTVTGRSEAIDNPTTLLPNIFGMGKL